MMVMLLPFRSRARIFIPVSEQLVTGNRHVSPLEVDQNTNEPNVPSSWGAERDTWQRLAGLALCGGASFALFLLCREDMGCVSSVQ